MDNEDIKLSPYHDWSDKDFDWKSLDNAIYYLGTRCLRWGRVGLWLKEKYGTLRVSTTCAFITEYDFLHCLLYPGRAYIDWPKWVRLYIDWPIGKTLRFLGVIKLIQRYQRWVLKHFWLKAAEKWPHIREEILDEYEDYFE